MALPVNTSEAPAAADISNKSLPLTCASTHVPTVLPIPEAPLRGIE